MNPFTGESEKNEIMEVEGMTGFVADLRSASKAMCSLKPTNDKERSALFKAANNPDKRLSEMINMTINVRDVYVEEVTCKNQYGDTQVCPRIVFIDDKLVGYQCVSLGIFGALKKLFQIYGTPTWKTPLKLMIKQINKGDKSLLTFDVVN